MTKVICCYREGEPTALLTIQEPTGMAVLAFRLYVESRDPIKVVAVKGEAWVDPLVMADALHMAQVALTELQHQGFPTFLSHYAE